MKKLLLPFFIIALQFPNQLHALSFDKLSEQSNAPWVVDAYYQDIKQLRAYAKKNKPWSVNTKENYFTVEIHNKPEFNDLQVAGFSIKVNSKQMSSAKRIKNAIAKAKLNKIPLSTKSIPGFSCYRTVEETFATMDLLVTQHPLLASVVDIGDTWNKIDSNGSLGYDMRVLKITNSAIIETKPILFAISSIHARELAPAELNTRFAEYLLNNYGTDADVTWIVDHREIHLLLQGNPDGRKVAETGESKRKNEDNTFCSNQLSKGVDMNRNFEFMWNQGSGSSSSMCSQTFRGGSNNATTHVYEPENEAINNYMNTIFTDQRGPALTDAAPDDATGVYIDIHSYSELVLWPYGYDSPGTIPLAPNNNQLQTLGRKFAWYNNYLPERSNELYGADGASDDNAYGQLGIASYTFELGTEFFQQCDIFQNTILPDNLKALIYAAKVAETPYITASGPDIDNILFSGNNITAGTVNTLYADATDLHFSGRLGIETKQNIEKVEMFVDESPWSASSSAIQLTAVDGLFDTPFEKVSATIDTTAMAIGKHTVYIQATDVSGKTGVLYAKYFNIVNSSDIGTVSGTITDSISNQPLNGIIVQFNQQKSYSNQAGDYFFPSISGTYDLSFRKRGYESQNLPNISIINLQNTLQNVQLSPICSRYNDYVDYSSISQAQSAGWAHGSAQGLDDWFIDYTGIEGSSAFSTTDPGVTTDKYLISPSIFVTSSSQLEFLHKYNFEGNSTHYDGAVIEISINGGSWQSLESQITLGGYNGALANGNPISGNGWGGQQNEFSKVLVDLSSFANSNIKIRWRLGADSNTGGGSWVIDDVKILDPIVCIDEIYTNGFE